MRLALVHGFTQTGRSWAPVQARLEDAGHEVVCPDLPGHGDNADVRADLSEAACRLADDIGPAVYVGYSLGGRVCLHLALDRPGVAERLVLVSTTAGIDDDAERAERRRTDETLAVELESGGVPRFIERWLAGPMWDTLAPDRRGVEERLANTAAGLASSLRLAGTAAQGPLWSRLAEIAIPVLVVTGDLDAKFTALGVRMAAGIGANATRVRVPGVGHALPWEQPELFAGIVVSSGTPAASSSNPVDHSSNPTASSAPNTS